MLFFAMWKQSLLEEKFYWISKVCFSKTLWIRCRLFCMNKRIFTTNNIKPGFFYPTVEPSFSQAEQSQISQPLLVSDILQFFNHLNCPLLDLLQYLHVSLGLRSPELAPALQVRPCQG